VLQQNETFGRPLVPPAVRLVLNGVAVMPVSGRVWQGKAWKSRRRLPLAFERELVI
jgi:hypothetical protein